MKEYEAKSRVFWTDNDWKNYLNKKFKTLKERRKFARKHKQPIPTGTCSLCKINLYGKNKFPLVSSCEMKTCSFS
mgnify:FL=1